MNKFPPPMRISLPVAFLAFGLLAALIDYEQVVSSNVVREQTTALARADRNGQRIASVAGILLPAGQQGALQQDLFLTTHSVSAGPGIVCDEQGKVICAGDPDWIGHDYRETPLKLAKALVDETQHSRKHAAMVTGDGRALATDTFTGGFTILEFDPEAAIEDANKDARLAAIKVAICFVVVGLVLWGFLHYSFATRIQSLVKSARAFAKDGSAVPKPLPGSDEIAELSLVFAQTGAALRERELALELAQQTLAEKNKELESIFYVASHDLRSPLVNVQGFSNDLLDSAQRLKPLIASPSTAERNKELEQLLDTRIPEAVGFVTAGASKMDALLKGLGKISRLGRAAFNPEPLDMNELIGQAAKAIEFQLQSIQATLKSEDLPRAVGDAVQISQVFSNLFDNAIKYRDPSRMLVITVTGKRKDRDCVQYSVTDNGRGIAKEHQKKIFEIFHRLDPHLGEGEGLGLTIAQRILDRNRGTIRVESEKGIGTTFVITLPAAENNLWTN